MPLPPADYNCIVWTNLKTIPYRFSFQFYAAGRRFQRMNTSFPNLSLRCMATEAI